MDIPVDERDRPFAAVALAASHAGIEALAAVLGGLPPTFPAPILVVQHQPPDSSFLVPVLARAARLPVRWAEPGMRLRPETVFVAPAGAHLVVEDRLRLGILRRPLRVDRVAPSADALFASMASVFGQGALAVVLTGTGSDGAAGARAIKDRGGAVLVQDPATARARGMPSAAIAAAAPEHVLPLRSIAPALVSLVAVRGARELFGLAGVGT